jgi:hypothetical protein
VLQLPGGRQGRVALGLRHVRCLSVSSRRAHDGSFPPGVQEESDGAATKLPRALFFKLYCKYSTATKGKWRGVGGGVVIPLGHKVRLILK